MARKTRVELNDSSIVEYYNDSTVLDWKDATAIGYRGEGWYYWMEGSPSRMVGPYETKELAVFGLNAENS